MKKIFLFFFLFNAFITSRAQCDTSKRPIVFVHGFLASGDSYALQIQRFVQQGYCINRLFVFDWNSVGGNAKKNDSLLNNFIDTVLLKTGADQVELVGHSAGGGLGRGYLLDSVHARKVSHYIQLASRKWNNEYSWFSNDRCLTIYSAADKIAGNGGGIVEGANNLDLVNKDHYEVATSMETFEAIYAFLNKGGTPSKKKEKETKLILLAGKAVLLGDNDPVRNGQVKIYQLNPKTGARLSQQPTARFTVTEQGNWGPYFASKNTNYEFELVQQGKPTPVISYFFEPFFSSNAHIYLRGFPVGNMISMMLGNLPAKDDQSLLVVYSANKAMIAGRDSVTVNGIPISSPALTPAAKTIISSFIFDDGDGLTSGKGLKQFGAAPFIGGTDIYLPSNNKATNTIYFNGRKLMLPARSSKERILLAVFN